MGKPQPDGENLAGLVERVTFHNEDSGFCVLRVKARGQRDLITVAASISAGEFVHASGHWVMRNTMPSTAIANLSGRSPINESVSQNRTVNGLAPAVRPPRPVSRSYAGLRCSTPLI